MTRLKTDWPWTSGHISLLESEILSSRINRSEPPPLENVGWGITDEKPKSIQLKSFVVTNLGDFNDERLARSEAFRYMLSKPGLKILLLHGNLGQSGIEG